MDLRLELRLSQRLVMTPQLQQAIKLLQLSRLELQQVLSQHLVENPLLDDLANDVQDEESVQEEENPERKDSDGEEVQTPAEGLQPCARAIVRSSVPNSISQKLVGTFVRGIGFA